MRLADANLVDADLSGSSLRGADLRGARIDVEHAVGFAAAFGVRIG